MSRQRAAGAAVLLSCAFSFLVACGRPAPQDDTLNLLPTNEGAYGTKITIGDLEAHMVPQLVAYPDPPGRGVEYQKFQDRREIVNSVTIGVPVDEPESLNIRFYVESRQDWDYHTMPVVTRSRIFAEQTDPITGETHRTPLESHTVVHGRRLPVEDLPSHIFDIMKYREQFTDVVTLVAESEVLILPPGTPSALVDPVLASAPINARTRVRSNPLRIEFQRAQLPTEVPIIVIVDDPADADEAGTPEESPETVE